MAFQSEINQGLTRDFNEVFPSAHSTNALPTDLRIFQAYAKGSRFWDVDGNEYVDYTGALGPNILGHCHSEYIHALKSHLDKKPVCSGSSYIYSEDDVILGKKILKHIPCAEKVKLCVSGSEAVQQAIRLARAYTGRQYYLKFGGHYHGWIDNIYGGKPDPAPSGRPFPLFDTKSTLGMSKNSMSEGLMIPWDDIEALEETLAHYADDIAIIIMEAICEAGTLTPRLGYLERIRELCDRYGIVMCFDEIITGFRVGLSGAQGLFGVTPDICTLGKALGGGLPISAIAGKADILGQFTDAKVKGGGTFNGNPLCVRGARSTIEILERDNGSAYVEMDRVQSLLMKGIDEIARRRGVPLRVQGPVGVFMTYFGADPDKRLFTASDMPDFDSELTVRFYESMLKHGVYTLCGRWFSSIAHTEQDNEQVLQVFDQVLATL